MARTITEIHGELLAAKEADPRLAALDSPSQFAIWRLWLYVVAVAIWTHEQLFDRHKKEVEAQIARNVFGSAEWFVLKTLEFQYGDDLIRDERGGLRYATISAEKRIVSQAAITTASEVTSAVIKVAKKDAATGDPTQLTPDELVAVRGYINRLQPPGSYILVNTLPADILKLSLSIYYNPLLDPESLKTTIETTVTHYLNNLPFNGKILRSKIVDIVLAVEGVEDVVIPLFEAKASGGVFQEIPRFYIPAAGYVKIDSGHPLKDHMTLKLPV